MRQAPTPTTPQSRAAADLPQRPAPFGEKEFDKAGLPEGLRSAFGLGKAKISKQRPKSTTPTTTTVPKAAKKQAGASKSTKAY